MTMQYSKSGLDLTKNFESCALMPYLDINGIPTDGWGNTHNVVMGVPITQEKADADLLRNCQEAVDAVNTHVTVPLTQGEFDALVDFTFNCGVTAFIKSTMLRLLNRGDYVGAAGQFELWDHASGKVVAGLLRRRVAEKDEFNGESICTPNLSHTGQSASLPPLSGSGEIKQEFPQPLLPLPEQSSQAFSGTLLPPLFPPASRTPRPQKAPPPLAQQPLKDILMNASTLFSDFAALVKADETKMIAPLLLTAMTNYQKAPTLVNFAAQAASFAEQVVNNQAIVGSQVASGLMAIVNGALQQMAATDAAQLAAATAPGAPATPAAS